ncbi:MAG TPA: arginine--tRNA ligase [Patescibacteria group bacterium]|nr:arginine--tRNA ligase [Patescibacteria group bacterium]
MLKDKIIKAIEEVSGYKSPELEFTENEKFGDYTSNIAMVFAKEKGKNPKELAESLSEKLKKDDNLKSIIKKIEVAGPGFINFWLKTDILVDNLIQIDKEKEKYGTSKTIKETWEIEHTSPNPNKAMHLGHLRNNVTGMAIANLAEAIGINVIRDDIDNDRGIAIAKLMWGYLKFARKDGKETEDVSYWFDNQSEWQTPKDLNLRPDRFVDQLYVKGAGDFEKNKETEEKVRNLVVDWEAEDKKVWVLWKRVLSYSYEGQELTLKRLGNKWDKIWHESDHYKEGKDMVAQGLKKGIFKKLDDGAVITDLAKYNIPDTVVIKKDGTALYITQDLALTNLKKKTFKADKLFWVIGPEQSLAMKQVFAVCEQLGIGKISDFVHLAYGYMSIKGQGKMSSRLGNVIYIDELLDLAKAKVKKIMDGADFKVKEIEEVSEMVGIGAVKYSILRLSRLQDMSFDLNESVSIEGNSGPYLQYTVARTNSVLAKVKTKWQDLKVGDNVNEEELLVLKSLVRFSEIIETAAKNYSPNLLCNYLYDLASKYNGFYNKCKIIGSDNEDFRLALTSGVGQVLKNGLKLLGIGTPERM